ncbi:hypothetical protein F8388_012232 [Cannabis sativa]|uniref:Uncharacterized protein n=1 Tax=Cannabis sativa TaxID=3483 RepID=A0A7J6E2L4_CANSA|nr:hypothetical protein F8388_012232 [Cannabis sativa]KAF4356759.1 hypothetical protein G4B88_017789 [Cannabis sativa]
MVRPSSCEKANLKGGLWSEEEDARMLEYVSKHGKAKWTSVPKGAGLRRCGKSCRLRWNNHLRPDLNHESFTPKEEELIVKLHAAIGSRWSMIAQQLPGRTDNDVKNYWNTKLRKKLSEMGIDPVTHKPFSQIIADYGNVGGLPKTGMRIGSLNKDLKNAILMKMDPKGSLSPLPNTTTTRHFMLTHQATTTIMTTNIAPKTEPALDRFLSNDNNISSNDISSVDLLSQLQAIKLVSTEASNYKPNNYESSLLPCFYPEATFSSPSSSSSSSTQEMPPLAGVASFNWNDFLLEDAFLPNDQAQEHETSMAELMNYSSSQNDLSQNQSEGSKDMDNTSFVEALLARENEMLLDEFPEFLAESLY